LLRPELLEFFTPEDLTVVSEIRGKKLVENGKISRQYSDHLPIVVSLNLESRIGE
jgi:hypothetical protein